MNSELTALTISKWKQGSGNGTWEMRRSNNQQAVATISMWLHKRTSLLVTHMIQTSFASVLHSTWLRLHSICSRPRFYMRIIVKKVILRNSSLQIIAKHFQVPLQENVYKEICWFIVLKVCWIMWKNLVKRESWLRCLVYCQVEKEKEKCLLYFVV